MNGRGGVHRVVLGLLASAVVAATLGLVPVAPHGTATEAGAFAPLLPPCGVPPGAPPPNGPAVDALNYARDHECVPQWTTDDYKRYDWHGAGESSNKTDRKYVVGAAATVSPSTLVIGDGSPQEVTLNFNSLYEWEAWGFVPTDIQRASAVRSFLTLDRFPASWQIGNNLYRYREPGDDWGSWSKNTNSMPVQFRPTQDCPKASAVSCPAEATFDPFFVGKDVQMLVPVPYNVQYPCGESWCSLDPIGNTTYLQINIDGGGDRNQPPVASFTSTPTGTAGQYQLVSTSSDPDPGDAAQLTYDWTFDDGTTAQGANTTHTFAKPGDHVVTLVVTDPDGASDTSSQTITVAPPTLGVAITLVRADGTEFSTGSLTKDEEVTAKVTVSASAAGVGPLRGIAFAGSPLAASPDGVVALTGPTPAAGDPFVLDPGATKHFTYRVEAVGTGTFDLTSAVDARDDAGRAVPRATAKRTSQVSALKVEVEVDPNQLDLELATDQVPGSDGLVTDPAYVAETTTVRVTITNEDSAAVEDVTFDGATRGLDLAAQRLGPGGVLEPAPAPTPFPLDVTSPAPAVIDSIAPGASKVVEFTVEATNGGRFDVTAPVHGTSTATDTRVGASDHAPLRVLTDVKLLAQVKVSTQQGRPPRVDEGESIAVFGTLRNLSTDETITVDPIQTFLQGNGQVLGPVDFGQPVPEVCGIGSFRATLEPGESKAFTIWIRTTPIGVPAGAGVRAGSFLTLDVGGTAKTDEGEGALDDDEVRVELGNGKRTQNGETGLRTTVNTKEPEPTFVSDFDGLRFFIGAFTKNLVDGVDAAGAAILPTLGAMARATPGFMAQALVENPGVDFFRQQIALWEYYYRSVKTLSTQGRQALIDQIVADVAAKYDQTGAELAALRAKIDAALDHYDETIAAWFTRIDQATDAGDAQELIDIVSEPAAPLGTAIADQAVGEAVVGMVCRVMKGGAADELAAAAADQEATAPARVEAAVEEQVAAGNPQAVPPAQAIKELPAGDLINPQQASAAWTVDLLTDANLRRFTDAKNGGLPVMVAVRARAEATLDWLRSRGGATLKPEAYKPKMVNPWDVDYLGYRSGAAGAGGDIGSGILAEPIPQALLESRIGGLDAKTQSTIRKRWAKRYKEWYGVEPGQPRPPGTVSKIDELKGLAPRPMLDANGKVVGYEGTLKVPKKGSINYAPNIDTAGRPVQMVERRFQLRMVESPPDAGAFAEGREYFEVWLEANDGPPGLGSMRRLAGDIDIVVVLGSDGRLLASQPGAGQITAAAVADQLTHIAGTQHGWTHTWGDAAGRAELLADHLWNENPALRGDPLLIYANGEARIGWFDPNKSYDVPDAGDPFVFLEGAPRTLDSVEVPTPGPPTLPDPSEQPLPTGWVSPLTALPFAKGIDAGPGLPPACPVVMDVAPGAQALRVEAGQAQQWTPGQGWSASDVGARCEADGSPVHVLPQTAVGDTSQRAVGLTVLSMADVGTDAAGWFQPGDRIVIDPGGPHEETAVVATTSPFQVVGALAKPHDPMEVVTYAPGFVRTPTQVTTTTAGVTTTTAAPTTDPVPPGPTTPSTGSAGTDAEATGALPRTGTDPAVLIVVGIVLVLAGAAVLVRARRRERGGAAVPSVDPGEQAAPPVS